MEQNKLRVAQDVAGRIDDEPGPAGDYLKYYFTTGEKHQLFLTGRASNAIFSC